MKISMTPYIDTNKIKYTPAVSTSSAAADEDFNTQLTKAKKAITALSVDTVLSGDKNAALEAAAILNNSGRSDLQAIGDVMSDYASSSDSMTESEAATAILQAAGYTSASPSSNSETSSTGIAGSSDTAAPAPETSDTTANLVSSTSKNLTCSDELESYFKEAAKTYNVDINLLKAIAMTESSFDPTATSSSGAMGVMQLMPFVAEELGIENAYDAHDNIMGGASVIASHLEKYNGELSLALAAYNAGSGAVDRAGGIPESASKYVKKVLGFYAKA